MNEMTFKQLMALPLRKWNDCSKIYDTLLLVSTRKKHDSGFAMMAIIGCVKNNPIEIAVNCCDDIEWKLPAPKICGGLVIGQLRTDCFIKSGAIHVWTQNGKFKVGEALSSTEIKLVNNV